MNIEQLIKEKRGTVVDVRTPEEFQGASVPGSVNIPVQEIPYRIEEFKNLNTPLILCCASGGRSGMAAQILSQQGIECVNAGSWMDVNFIQSKTV